MINLWTYSVSF